jgi:hypothetical protein
VKFPWIVVDTANDNKVVAMASDESDAKDSIRSAERPPMNIKDKSTLKIVKTRKKQYGGMPLVEDAPTNNMGDGKIAGWIAIFQGKKLEIKIGKDAESLYGAKKFAIKHFKVPKSKVGLLAIEPAYNESVDEDAPTNNMGDGKIADKDNVMKMDGRSKNFKSVMRRIKERKLKEQERLMKAKLLKWGIKEEVVNEEEYEAFFKKAMKKFKIKDVEDLSDKERVKFFNWVDKNWDAGENETD